MDTCKRTTSCLAGALLLAFGSAAWADDEARVYVSEINPPLDALTEGGTPLNQGAPNWSSASNIQLLYVHTGYTFPDGVLGTFNLGVGVFDKGSGQTRGNTVTSLDTEQQGGSGAVTLTPDPGAFSNILPPGHAEFPGYGELDGSPSVVSVAIDCSDPSKCNDHEDGAEINAQLSFSAVGANPLRFSDGVKVQVRVRLVHPTECVRLQSFVTDQGFEEIVTSTDVGVVKNGKNAGKVTATTPYGQFSYNVLLANTCGSTESFDLGMSLDENFDTNPSNNPGNAVFTYVAGGAVDSDSFDIDGFGDGAPRGQSLCLQNIEIGPSETFLATVHMGIKRGIHQSSLGDDFEFAATLHSAGGGCLGTPQYESNSEMAYSLK